MRYNGLMIIILICLISTAGAVRLDVKQHPSFEDVLLLPSDKKVPTDEINLGSGSDSSNRISINYEQTEFPMEVTKKVLYNGKETLFVNDTACILVEIKCLSGKKIRKADIWEYTDLNLDIDYPTYYLRSSLVKELAEFEKEQFPLLYLDDVSNTSGLIKEIQNKNDRISSYIKNSSEFAIINELLNQDRTDKEMAKIYMIKLINSLLDESELYKNVTSLNLSYKAKNKISQLMKEGSNEYEVLLCNRLLLENLYPRGIKGKLTRLVNSPHEDKFIKIEGFDSINDLFYIPVTNIYSRESISYKYYIIPLREGTFNTYTLIRAEDEDGKLYEAIYPLKIQSLNKIPEFDIQVDISKLDLDEETKTILRYDIRYLGGSYDSCCYNIEIENSSQYIVNNHNFTRTFEKGRTESIETYIYYPESGVFNIPSITIDHIKYSANEHVTVEWKWVKWFNRYYPFFSLIIVIGSLIFYGYEILLLKKKIEEK